MKALITGIGGFAGTHLAAYLLESGDQVLGCSSRGQWPPDVPDEVRRYAEILPWDLRHEVPAATRQKLVQFAPDTVYHLAALSVPSQCGDVDPSADAIAVNVQGTEAVLTLAADLKSSPRLLFASSCYVYDSVSSESPIVTEAYPVGPRRGYGKSKLLAERLIEEKAPALGVEAIIARAFQHSGPRQSPLMILPDWASQLAAGNDPLRIICRDAYLDLSDVRDVVQAYRALVVDGKPQTVYNVGSGVCRRSGDVLEKFLQIAACQPEIIELNPGHRQHPIADVSRITAHTGWKPRIELQQTLADIFSYWQQRNASP